MKMILYLTGFMGAGKSTIGPILGNTIGWDSFDLDVMIEKKVGKKIRKIFEEDGEKFFRQIETETLRDLSTQSKIVVSLGGGTMVSEENLTILKNSGIIIYLKASTDSFYKRLKHKRDRPSLLVNEKEDYTEEDLLERIDNLMMRRTKYYEKADIIIDTSNSPVGRTVDQIVREIKASKKNKI